MELVDTLVLEASASAWEFESPHPHQNWQDRPFGEGVHGAGDPEVDSGAWYFAVLLDMHQIKGEPAQH